MIEPTASEQNPHAPVKPPFAYFGGKTTLAPTIADLLPKHEHYVEPFAGSLAVLLAKRASRAETVNDIDGDLTTFWRVLRDRPAELARLAMLSPHSREDYTDSAKDLASVDDELERARLIWVRLTQSRSHSMKPTGWIVARDVIARAVAPGLKSFAGRIESAADRIKNVSIENRDALDLIADYGREPTVCIYADPPYLGSLRTSNYRAEMLTVDLHAKLATALRGCKASVVLSGYASPLYEDLYQGWYRTELKAPTSLSGSNVSEWEVLWSNVPLDVQGVLDFGAVS